MEKSYYSKLYKVIRSCRTMEQLEVAHRLTERVCKQGVNSLQLHELDTLLQNQLTKIRRRRNVLRRV
jgi:hypothetical protein